MNNEEIKNEFAKWIDLEKPTIWYRKHNNKSEWKESRLVSWEDKYIYIINDRYSELRKLQIDNPKTKFQMKQFQQAGYDNKGNVQVKEVWIDVEPNWDYTTVYRVKPLEWYKKEENRGKPIWVRDNECEEWYVDIFLCKEGSRYICEGSYWKYAKPITKDEIVK